jgi:hypothetical protein
LAFHYSYQARFDYWLSTNNLTYTAQLASETDDFLRKILCDIAGTDIFAAPAPGTPIPEFISERVSLKTKAGGLGFRRLSQRYLLLNSLSNTLPQAIDRKDEKGINHPGLWNSLSDILGEGSFDAANKDHCWSTFRNSGTCNGVFGKCLRHYDLLSESDEENFQKNFQRIIPDGVVDARLVAAEEPFASPHNRLFGVETLVEIKALSQTTLTPDDRAREVQQSTESRTKYMTLTFQDPLLSGPTGPTAKMAGSSSLSQGPSQICLMTSRSLSTFSPAFVPCVSSINGTPPLDKRWL